MSKMNMDYFKICFLDPTGLPEKYILFLPELDAVNVTENNLSSMFSHWFSNVEWNYILEKKLESNILISKNIQVHPDDSVATLKKKIARILFLQEEGKILDTNEMYLFSCVEKQFSVLSIYKRLTQLDTKPLTKNMLNQFIANFNGISNYLDSEEKAETLTEEEMETGVKNTFLQDPLYQEKSVFTYEDLLEIDWFYSSETTGEKRMQKIPIGLRFVEKPHDPEDPRVILNQDVFSSNPFDILLPDLVYIPSKDVALQTFESDFLFHYTTGSSFLENTIYICTYNSVLTFLTEGNAESENTYGLKLDEILDIYFPNISTSSRAEIDDSRSKDKTKTNEYFWEQESLVDMIYNIYYSTATSSSSSTTNYLYDIFSPLSTTEAKNNPIKVHLQGGIYAFHFIIHPEKHNKLPLETIFKNIHASERIPFIQYVPAYHPGVLREKMFRFYYLDTAKNGNQIPVLSKSTIQRLTKKQGKMENITMFVSLDSDTEGFIQENENFLAVSFESNGSIVVQAELTNIILPTKINEWLQTILFYATENMNIFTKSVGYNIQAFTSLESDNIEIIFLHYRGGVELEKKFDLEKWMGVFSPFFYPELNPDSSTSTSSAFYKRYKRVEYFQAMDKHEEYISQLLRITQERNIIISELKKKFPDLSIDMIREKMEKYQEKHQSVVIPGRFANKRVEFLEHTGFRTVFQKAAYENEWTVEVFDMVSLEYVFLVHMYLNVLFLVSQSPDLIPSNIFQKHKKPILPKKSSIAIAIATSIIDIPILPIFTEGLTLEDGEPEEKPNREIEAEKKVVEEEIKAKSVVKSIIEESNEEEAEAEEYEIPDVYESDDENSEESSSKEKGGSGKKSKGKKKEEEEEDEDEDEEEEEKRENKKGKKRANQTLGTYFMDRIQRRDPLITKTGFARICPANEKRQPIILTEKEKQKIDRNYNDPNDKPYSHSLKYGADKDDNPLYYICPSYWCIKPGEEGPLTETDVQNKKCGEIIQDPKNIQPGEYTYKGREEFSEPGFVNRKIKTDVVINKKTGEEVCYPCCFQNWNGKAQQERRNQCNPDEYGLHPKQKKIQEKKAMIPSTTRNILDINRVPLPYGRIGLLQIPIQLFLNASAANICVDSQNMPKLNCPLLVRYGASQTQYENQYFLGCLADMYSYQRNEIIAKTIPEIREILCSAISLDHFIQLHNASLVALFRYPKDDFLEIKAKEEKEIDIRKYENTEFYKRLNLKSETHLNFLESTIESYENFLIYLRDEETVMDPTYLWEAVCQKNPALLPRGVNLAIIEILNNDITNNVELICPTSSYATLYDPAKETWILVKQGEVYEPVYLYEITNLNPEKTNYKKTFIQGRVEASRTVGQAQGQGQQDKSGINRILKMIQNWTSEHCAPISRKAKGNVFERNISAKDLLMILKDLGGFSIRSVKYQILNYQNKIIGFLVDVSDAEFLKEKAKVRENRKLTIFLPTFPSAIIPKVPSKWMDEPDIWNTYDSTVFFLQEIYRLSDQRILSKPLYRVIEDEKVVGVITMTNQFLQIMPFEDNREFSDGLKTLPSGMNPIPIDREIMIPNRRSLTTLNPILSEKMRMVRNIRLETQFYQAFRNTVRIVLNLYRNRNIREEIRVVIFDTTLSYLEKRTFVISKLKMISKDLFVYQNYSEEVLNKIQEVFLCSTSEGQNNYCLMTSSSKGKEPSLILPQRNLVNIEQENEPNYYRRLADELVRFKRVRLFMMYPDSFLPLTSGEYKVNADEFVIPKSILTDTYFSELKMYPLEKYVQTNTFETANPNAGIPANPTLLWTDAYQDAYQRAKK